MSFLDSLKELATVVVEAAKENPVAAIAIGVGSVAVGATGVYAKRRFFPGEKPAGAPVAAAVEVVAAEPASEAAPAAPVVAAEPSLTDPKFQHPERPAGISA